PSCVAPGYARPRSGPWRVARGSPQAQPSRPEFGDPRERCELLGAEQPVAVRSPLDGTEQAEQAEPVVVADAEVGEAARDACAVHAQDRSDRRGRSPGPGQPFWSRSQAKTAAGMIGTGALMSASALESRSPRWKFLIMVAAEVRITSSLYLASVGKSGN